MARLFIIDGREMSDPNPALSVEEVKQQYAAFFPELVNASVTERKEGGNVIYTFEKRVGTKGEVVNERS